MRTCPRARRVAAAWTIFSSVIAAAPRPLISASLADRRRYYFRERTERRDQSLCERFDVTPRNCAKQHELEEFVVVDGFCTGFTKTGAQPLAMAMIVMPDMWDRVFRHKTKLA